MYENGGTARLRQPTLLYAESQAVERHFHYE